MSEFFAEASVRLTPDLTGFVTDLRKDVKAAVEKVEGTPAAKIKIAPALTRDFVGSLRKQVNIAVAQAQRGIKPIQVRAVLSDVSRAQIGRELRSRTQVVGGIPTRAAGAGASSGGGPQLTAPQQNLLNTAIARGLPLLGQQAAATGKAGSAAKGAAAANKTLTSTIVKLTPAQRALATAQTATLAATLAAAGSPAQATQLKTAQNAILTANALAIQAGAQQGVNQAVIQALGPLQSQVTGLQASHTALTQTSAALRKHEAAARSAARSHEQLSRGAQATGLSLLGIRGATLAASRSFLIGAAAITLFAKAVQSATEFSTQMNVFRATASATATELERVRASARALGADITLPGVTAADAAEAMTELAKAGLSVEDSLAGARGVLQLATAAAIDNAQATELAANAINAFELAGRDATRVADTFANAANAAQGSIVDIGIAFQQAAAAGRQVGLSFEDTSLFLTVLARNGLRGSDAGTSLRTALLRLIKPTKEAKEELKNLGIETRDAAGNLRPDVFIQLAEATRNLSPAARDAKLALIGGQDAFRAISILGRQSIEDLLKLRRELREQGTAAELAAARMTGLRGSIEALSNTLSTVGSRVGTAFTPSLITITDGLTTTGVQLASSTLAAQTFAGGIEFLDQVMAGLGATMSVVIPVLSAFTAVQAKVVNTIGVPTILAAVAAYKLLPIVLGRATAALVGLRNAAVSAQFALALLRDPGVTGKAAFFNLYALAATAAAAAIFYLATRETTAERATRELTEATEGLISAQERLNQTRGEARDAPLQVSGAQLGVFEAQQAAQKARAKVRAAPADTFTRTKAELELAVALDNVAIAQNNLTDTQKRAEQAQEVAIQAAANEKKARQEEIRAIARLVAVRKGLASIRSGGGPLAAQTAELAAVRDVTKALQKRIDVAREEASVESIALAKRLELLQGVSAALGKLPTPEAIKIAIDATNVKAALDQLVTEFGVTGTEAVAALQASVNSGLTDQLTSAFTALTNRMGDLLKPPFEHGGREAHRHFVNGFDAKRAGEEIAAGLIQGIKNLEGQAKGLDVQADLAVIASGATGATLPVLEQQLANARERERKARAAIAANPKGETPKLRERLNQAIADQARLITEIRGINAQLASDAKSAADDAKTKQDEIFDNILKAMGIRRDARQQAIEDAQLTEGSGDDLSANRRLRQLVNVQIDRIKARIEAARKEGLNVAVLIAGLRVLEGIYRQLGRTVISLQKTRKEEIAARVAESNQLDIAFAETTGNKQAEIRARLKEIARLRKLQALAKGDILERKRLRNLIAEQEQAIADITAELGKVNNANAEMQFKFLQTQTGFAASLLGNLIPGGLAPGGLVGGTTAGAAGVGAAGAGSDNPFGPPLGTGSGPDGLPRFPGARGAAAGAAAKAAAAVAAGQTDGPTRGQQATEIELLRRILRVLGQIRGGTSHPEAKHAQKTGGGGGGGSDIM